MKECERALAASERSELVTVDPVWLDFEMALTGTRNADLSRATQYAQSYVSEVRNGLRRRVSREFLMRADDYLRSRRRPGALATRMMMVVKSAGD